MISVIIPVREGSTEHLDRKLSKLGGPTGSFEIIVVDDCSPVSQKGTAEKYGARYIRLDDPKPYNMMTAKNVGVQAVSDSCGWLCMSDVDVLFRPEDLLRLMDQVGDADIAMGVLKVPQGKGWVKHLAWRERIFCLCLVKRQTFLDIGGCEERLAGGYGFEDDILWFRLRKLNAKVVYVEDAVAYMSRLDKGSYARESVEASLRRNRGIYRKLMHANDMRGSLLVGGSK